MMKTRTSLTRILPAVMLASMLLGLAGCGDGESPKSAEKPKVSSAKLRSLQDNLAKLSSTMDELKQDLVTLNSRIDATQRQLAAVRARIAALNERGPVALDTRADMPAATQVEPPTPPAEGDQAGKSFTRNLLLAVFIVFVAVYGYSLWKKRESPGEESAEEPTGETEDNPTYTYPSPSKGEDTTSGGQDSPAPPADSGNSDGGQ